MKHLNAVLIALVLCLLSGLANAEQKVDVNIPGGGAQDLLNMTTIPQTISNKGIDNTMTTACTNSAGRVIYQGEPGYPKCIDDIEKRRGKQGAQPANVANDPSGSHVITIPAATKPGN